MWQVKFLNEAKKDLAKLDNYENTGKGEKAWQKK